MKLAVGSLRLGPRSALAALACAALLVASAGVAPAQPSPSPSPSQSDQPAIHLLNPSGAYDPKLDPTGEPDPPKISDKLDVDTTYHVVAWTNGAAPDDVVEASIVYEGQNEISIGTLDPSPNAAGAWELAWDVPNDLPKGSATIHVGLFGRTADGFVEKAHDDVAVDVEQHDPDGSDPTDNEPAAETVELTWPAEGGQLGFYRPRGGSWIGVVDGTASQSAGRVEVFYSESDPGAKPEFKKCGSAATGSSASFGVRPITFSANCTLGFGVAPTDVTALAAVAEMGDPSNSTFSQAAADVHVVHPYMQSPSKMTLSLSSAFVRALAPQCVVLTATVKDELGRPVQGANVDAHVVGPDDQVAFGTLTASGHKAPDDRDEHGLESGSNCAGSASGQEGIHRRPAQPDIKHEESTLGTGLSGPMNIGPGQWRFAIYSATPGIGDVTAWVDDEELPQGASNRPLDDDLLEGTEPIATAHAQWYAKSPTVSFAPAGATAAPGQCQLFIAKARAGTAAIPRVNLDLHAQSKLDSIRFCSPEGSSPLRAPDKGTHDPIDAAQSKESTGTTFTVHTETETNSEGDVQFGLVSPSVGNATVTGWIDGETGADNDVLDGAEPRATAGTSWADCANAGHVSFVNPSAYGSTTTGPGTGTDVSTQLDADQAFHVVVRTDCPDFASAVEIQLATGTTFKTIGEASRIGQSDTYEFDWSPVPADGSYKLRAHVSGAPADQDQTVVVNAQDATGGDPTETADETVEMTSPANGTAAGFVGAATEVDGIASAGAEGVDLFYTRVAAKDTPQGPDWISCGYVDLGGTGSKPQPFVGQCSLQGADQPSQVTGIAALSADCGFGQDGCDASPSGTARSLPMFKKDSGDAHRVYGYDALPFVEITPAENEAAPNQCERFVLVVEDATTQPLTGQNIDVHATGPGDDGGFCSVSDGTPFHAPDQGGHSAPPGTTSEGVHENPSGPDTYHIEGQTDTEGRFVFGVRSSVAGDMDLAAWIDRTDDDVPSPDEPADGAVMHWASTSPCTLVGTSSNDHLRGTPGPDRICGLGGDDVVRGRGGADVLVGAAGNDRLFGGAGDDRLLGGLGNDRLGGGKGRDACRGGPGRDHLRGCEPGRRR